MTKSEIIKLKEKDYSNKWQNRNKNAVEIGGEFMCKYDNGIDYKIIVSCAKNNSDVKNCEKISDNNDLITPEFIEPFFVNLFGTYDCRTANIIKEGNKFKICDIAFIKNVVLSLNGIKPYGEKQSFKMQKQKIEEIFNCKNNKNTNNNDLNYFLKQIFLEDEMKECKARLSSIFDKIKEENKNIFVEKLKNWIKEFSTVEINFNNFCYMNCFAISINTLQQEFDKINGKSAFYNIVGHKQEIEQMTKRVNVFEQIANIYRSIGDIIKIRNNKDIVDDDKKEREIKQKDIIKQAFSQLKKLEPNKNKEYILKYIFAKMKLMHHRVAEQKECLADVLFDMCFPENNKDNGIFGEFDNESQLKQDKKRIINIRKGRYEIKKYKATTKYIKARKNYFKDIGDKIAELSASIHGAIYRHYNDIKTIDENTDIYSIIFNETNNKEKGQNDKKTVAETVKGYENIVKTVCEELKKDINDKIDKKMGDISKYFSNTPCYNVFGVWSHNNNYFNSFKIDSLPFYVIPMIKDSAYCDDINERDIKQIQKSIKNNAFKAGKEEPWISLGDSKKILNTIKEKMKDNKEKENNKVMDSKANNINNSNSNDNNDNNIINTNANNNNSKEQQQNQAEQPLLPIIDIDKHLSKFYTKIGDNDNNLSIIKNILNTDKNINNKIFKLKENLTKIQNGNKQIEFSKMMLDYIVFDKINKKVEEINNSKDKAKKEKETEIKNIYDELYSSQANLIDNNKSRGKHLNDSWFLFYPIKRRVEALKQVQEKLEEQIIKFDKQNKTNILIGGDFTVQEYTSCSSHVEKYKLTSKGKEKIFGANKL